MGFDPVIYRSIPRQVKSRPEFRSRFLNGGVVVDSKSGR